MRWILAAVLVALLAGCSAPAAPASSPSAPARSAPTRITAVVSGAPAVLYNKISDPAIAGVSALEALVNAGLSLQDPSGTAQARLAESLPSVDNGLWTMAPDGTMETTWRIRQGATWHDGVPFDSADLLFTAQVVRDPELPSFGDPAFRSLSDVRAVDDRTVVVSWSRPYIYADQMFGTLAMPIPRHLMESAYTDTKATFEDQPYWSSAFIGNGPFKLKEWEPGSHLVVEAFDGYVLGRPKIDEIDVRVIIDTNVLVSNVLSSQVDVSLGRNLSPEQGATLRQQWQGGKVDVGRITLALNAWPQLVNPSPMVVSDLRFRRALYEALDRQTMAETLEGGLAYVADGWVTPSLPEYADLAQSFVRYDYDPARARQEIQALSYTAGPDGIWRDGAGSPLSIEIQTIALPDLNQRTLLTVADSWQRAGVGVAPDIVPAQRVSDPQYRSSFPGFQLLRYPSDVFSNGAGGFHSLASRLPENNFIARGPGGGINWSRYANPEMDALVDRFFATVSRRERLQVAGQIVHLATDQLPVLPLFWDPSLNLVSNRVQGVPPIGDSVPWNVEQWQVTK